MSQYLAAWIQDENFDEDIFRAEGWDRSRRIIIDLPFRAQSLMTGTLFDALFSLGRGKFLIFDLERDELSQSLFVRDFLA